MSDERAMNVSQKPATTVKHTRPSFSVHRSALVALVLTIVGALAFTTVILFATGTPPLEAYRLVFFGAFLGLFRDPPNYRSLADAAMLAAPLLLCASGLTLSFAAGLYNLGVEGQMVLGAVFTMAVLRLLPDLPPPLLWMLAFVAGGLGGALWAAIAVLLKIYGRVSEIFAGLGLNFLSTGVALYLVFGPWKRPGIASMSGTEPLPDALRLPTLEPTRFAPIAAIIALVALALVWFLSARTSWGLAVRATGINAAAAERLGVPSVRRLIEALCGCGALAGLAGAVQVLAVFHALIPNISSGIGLLGLLVALLVRANPAWVLPVTLAFACFTAGSIQLPLAMNVDSSLSGVLQGALVLFALAARGFARR